MSSHDVLGKIVQRLVKSGGMGGMDGSLLNVVYDILEKLENPHNDPQTWISELKRFARKEPCWVEPKERVIVSLDITDIQKQVVNYDRTIADSLKAGKYDWTNCNITDANFPSTEVGQKEVKFGLFHLNNAMKSGDVIAQLEQEGFRPVTLKELLVYGEKYPNVQRKFPIIALGSVAKLDGYRCVGYLDRSGSERCANLYCSGRGWDGFCRFLVVRN